MKFHRVLPLMLALGPTTAWASDLSVGIGLGPQLDLAPRNGDIPTSADLGGPVHVASCKDDEAYAGQCGIASILNIGGSLRVPFRYALTQNAALRFGPRIDYGGRQGQVSYNCNAAVDSGLPLDECERANADMPPGEEFAYVYGSDHFAFTLAGMATFGPEFSVPTGESAFYFGAEVGVGVAYSFDSLETKDARAQDRSPTDGTVAYRDPACDPTPEEEIGGDECTQEARNTQPVIGVEAIVGWRGAGDSPFFVELGYSATRVSGTEIGPGYADGDNRLDLQRTPYLWNPVRVTAGLQFAL